MSTQFDITKASDQCVMCGMCLPHCPTYQVSQHEAESPRGRISLIKAFAEGQLSTSDSLESHINSCTGCLRCQQVCPAKVNYQAIIDSGRQLYLRKQSYSGRLLTWLAIQTSTHRIGHLLILVAAQLNSILPLPNGYSRLLKYVNKTNRHRSLLNTDITNVNIFTGCTGRLFDKHTLTSLLQILEAIGVEAKLADNIYCCGALSQHSGSPSQAKKYINKLKKYLAKQSSSTVLSFASGCGRQLDEQLSSKSFKHYDALYWLSLSKEFQNIEFKATKLKVLIHTPCTIDHDKQNLTYKLLSKIPNIELFEFNDNLACCGAGGLQLAKPEKSNQRLLVEKINTIHKLSPDLIVSANVGCSLNFKLGLNTTGLDIEVIHPLTLLARQLITKTHD